MTPRDPSPAVSRAPFEVEGVLEIAGSRGVVVLARALGSAEFDELRDGATLGGCAIRPWTEIPRALDAHGSQRLDLFVFWLLDAADRVRFSPGQQVELVTRPLGAPGEQPHPSAGD